MTWSMSVQRNNDAEITRREEILRFICRYAKENNGVTPPARSIAAAFKLGKTIVLTHITKLIAEERLAWVDDRLKVVDSEWIEPPDVEVGTSSDRLSGAGPSGHLGDELIGKVNGMWIAEWARMPSGYMLSMAHGVPVLAPRQQPEAELRGHIEKLVVQEGVLLTFEFYRHAGYAPRIRNGAILTRIGNAAYAPPSEYAALPLAV